LKLTAIASIALGLSLASPLAASAQMYHHMGHGHMHVQGRIASLQGSDLTLDNGATVFLKPGTVINTPNGKGRLHAGEFVTVDGFRSGDRNINATEVDVRSRR